MFLSNCWISYNRLKYLHYLFKLINSILLDKNIKIRILIKLCNKAKKQTLTHSTVTDLLIIKYAKMFTFVIQICPLL